MTEINNQTTAVTSVMYVCIDTIISIPFVICEQHIKGTVFLWVIIIDASPNFNIGLAKPDLLDGELHCICLCERYYIYIYIYCISLFDGSCPTS